MGGTTFALRGRTGRITAHPGHGILTLLQKHRIPVQSQQGPRLENLDKADYLEVIPRETLAVTFSSTFVVVLPSLGLLLNIVALKFLSRKKMI